MKVHHLIATLLVATLPALAEEGHGHGHGHGQAEVAIPATLPELWADIEKDQSTLVSALEKKDAATVHTATQSLVAYVNALPSKCTGLDQSKLARIIGQTKNLARVYGDVHHAADDGAFDKALVESGKAAAILKLLKPQLPL
jgi:hypothetical protein